MSKQNVLFIFLGIIVGFVGGFSFANSVNRSEASGITRTTAASVSAPAGNAPGGNHPATTVDGAAAQGGMQPDVQATIERAKSAPDDFEAQVKAAEMYYMIQRYEPSLTYLQRAHELRPDDYGVIVRLGNANFYLERYGESGDWYERAVTMRPTDVGARTDLGLSFYLRGDLDRAITEYRRALELNDKHEEALQNLIVALRDRKNTDEARQMLARLEASHPQNESIVRLRESLSRN